MLKDYGSFVDTAQDKLKNDSISARDLNHMKQQLTAHKVCYFNDDSYIFLKFNYFQ